MPLDLHAAVGHAGVNLLYVLTGIAFGFALEQAGFGNARNLAAQFYLRDMRVLKVMFTAIVTAMLLLLWAGVPGWVDPSRVFVNPTHLWPGILGGLIFGAGFVIGGYCPGTALVSLSTLKLDGLFFVLGLAAGMVAFGRTVGGYRVFWDTSGYLGELTLMDVFGLPAGAVALAVVLMALGMFFGAEKIEAYFARRDAREGGSR